MTMYNPLKFYTNEVIKTIGDRAKEILTFMYPAVTISEENGEVVVEADLPGFEKKDVKVRVDKNALVIQGSRKLEEKGTIVLNQRPESVFKRVSLPYDIEADVALSAKLQNGVLVVKIPVKGSRAVKIE